MNISSKYVESTVNSALNVSISQQYNLRPLQSETAASYAEIAGSNLRMRSSPETISAR